MINIERMVEAGIEQQIKESIAQRHDLGIKPMSFMPDIPAIVKAVFEENPEAIDEYLHGDALRGYNVLMGQCMRKGRGACNPKWLAEEINNRLNERENNL
jgi:Asp-tRNA(Asn)/Glu-tRNA(Gln) amidotransferase B subunit